VQILYPFIFCFTILKLIVSILWHRVYWAKKIDQHIAELELECDGELSKAERKKIISRQILFVPVIAEAFARLHHNKTNAAEQKRLLYFFINSSLFDDFTDEQLLTPLQIAGISFDDKFTPHHFRERLFLHIKKQLNNFAQHKSGYTAIQKAVFESQMDSEQQLNPSTPNEQLLAISLAKGGYAVELCSYYTNQNITATERQCWYQLGAMIQLSNDIFDIYKDVQQGIHTYPNRCTNMNELSNEYIKEVRLLHQYINALEVSSYKKIQLTTALSVIIALGFTAITQLKKLQGNNSVIAPWESFQRSQLICDMEKLPNMLRWFSFCYQWGYLKP